jgi:hypothetical protein
MYAGSLLACDENFNGEAVRSSVRYTALGPAVRVCLFSWKHYRKLGSGVTACLCLPQAATDDVKHRSIPTTECAGFKRPVFSVVITWSDQKLDGLPLQ